MLSDFNLQKITWMIDLKNSKNQDKILLVKIMQIDEQAVKT